MAEPNQCDVWCPRRTLVAAEYREDTSGASPLKKARLAVQVGVAGVGQMLRAATCANKDLSPRDWQPHPECLEDVATSIEQRPINWNKLYPHERAALEEFLPSGE